MKNSNSKVLYLAWQDPESRSWHTVGRLTHENGMYKFVYTKGALESDNFIEFGRMTDMFTEYKSKELFPLFSNRLLSKNRPEYEKFISWLNLEEDQADPFVLLSRTGGERVTDSLVVYPCPMKDEFGNYTVHFFSHGLRHMPKEALDVVNSLSPGDALFLAPEPTNPYDRFAIEIKTGEPPTVVGYCPRFCNEDFHYILNSDSASTLNIKVEKVNLDAPIQMRLLCKLTSKWPKGFSPCSGDEYTSIAQGECSPVSVGVLEALH